MKRREFLAAGTISAFSLSGKSGKGGERGGVVNNASESTSPLSDRLQGETAGRRQFIEIEIYWAPDEEKKGVLIEKIDSKVVPFRNKMGFFPVGVFTVDQELHIEDRDYDPRFNRAVFVVAASDSLSSFIEFPRKAAALLTSDDFINQNPADLDYVDRTTELLYAFHGFPTLDVPNLSPERVLQLRRYNSMNENRNRAKIRMFDGRGELPLFQSCGMAPVFFGETLYGDMMPSLTYLLSFKDEDARIAGWKKFVESPEWKQMSGEEEFRFTATRIRNLCLRPTPGSQI